MEDTFSPILRGLTVKLGQDYTREVERNMFSQTREEAMKYVMVKLGIGNPEEAKKIYNMYFEERDNYLKEHSSILINGLEAFLERLSNLNVVLICYGGLEEEQIVDEFIPYMKYFDRYVCTNNFRPGIKEITKDIYNLEYSQVLFIDDVNKVAETAKSLNTPFIGVPSKESWSYQKQDMIKTGVKYLVESINEIDASMLEKIDFDAEHGKVWS
ncbi:hypothetical protein QQO53_02705 [Clostridioides difficile]|nr:hypothetical protein [Clostridioides difficile]EJA6846935.1 hypothetical protein [Clostridioides difficile]MBH7523804.1 hypothetical protein [Clostridioides difficile]MBY1847541.1 hypothetical protein [Clostridioides difficile]MCM3843577.1 hypothetical protein [Clostridioides difficile]MDL0234132.1 hypothetical protein [Clostridioides difficile]